MGGRRQGGHGRARESAPTVGFGRRTFLKGAAASAGAATLGLGALPRGVAAGPNAITNENELAGAPPDQWESWEDDTIEGFATQISVNAGETVHFKIRTDATAYTIRIFRMGWYQGHGARLVTEISPSAVLPQVQPAPLTDLATGLVDCGNWAVSASWAVPASATSGVYLAYLERPDTGDSNRIPFVVRNDGRASDVLLQTSDSTWHAYNNWGGNSLYTGETVGRAFKVSYNRPLRSITGTGNSFFDSEYPLIRWLERNGYDVAYTTNVDSDRRPQQLLIHKLFVSSGHDEYWSAGQRANVEAARDAGVHLAFITANEVFWKTRWEPSLDAAATPGRTLVCYKETLASAKLDPTPEWTGTWRDPRFSPPSDGGNPETALMGQIFGAINEPAPDPAIEVPAQYGALRFWRNTDVATADPGATVELTYGSLGYEWDDDRDVGVKPPGLVELSSTTHTAHQVLVDHGQTYVKAPATHRLTMHRASSGALVFASGTCQWSWGLDDFHPSSVGVRDGDLGPLESGPPQVRMQQATANLLADMGCLPSSLQSGLVQPVPSTDVEPPLSVITAPAAGAAVPVGSLVTVTGTASDELGTVATVEVSTDGGTTWQRAAGTTAWSHVFMPTALGPMSVRSRAVDDSLNMETPGPGLTLTGAPRAYPASIWHETVTPATPATADTNPIEVGLRFRTAEDGFIAGVRFYKGAGNTGTHVGHLWTATGQLLAEVTFAAETESGWQQALFADPVAVEKDTTFVVSYFAPNGHYAGDTGYFANGAYDVWPLRALADGEDGPNGRFLYGSSGFPASSYGASNYWVDVVFDIDDARVPTVLDRNPAPGLEAVALDATPQARFSEAMTGGSIELALVGPDSQEIPGETTYESSTRTATFTPDAPLDPLTTYVARVVAAEDRAGNPLAAPVDWSFTTTGDADQYPLTLWDTSATPALAAENESQPVELGVRFLADADGHVAAVRFYKGPGNTGAHVTHLWSIDGTLLGTATPAVESTTGWQQANFPEPIEVLAGQLYVASYHAPAGHYSADSGAFNGAGVDRGVLHAPSRGQADGNGVYRYGAAGYPANSWNGTNYWVDVVYVRPPDVAGPTVVDVSPAPGLVSVALATPVTVRFDESIDEPTLELGLTGPGGAVAADVAYDPATLTATLVPDAPLAEATVYTATVTVSDLVGNPMADAVSWEFTTVTPAGATPTTIWDSSATPEIMQENDLGSIELGLRFRADSDGHAIGVRFHKGPDNAGPHVGHLWHGDGTLLGAVNFTDETASGWQQAALDPPVPITAGQTYVVSYHAPAGRYSSTPGAFAAAGVDRAPLHALRSGVDGPNGVYRYGPSAFPDGSYNATNYWVDLVFVDDVGPRVVATSPGADATGVPTDAVPSATFSEPIDAGALTFTVRDAGVDVAGEVEYEPATRTVTFTPAAPLVPGTAYTATVGGAVDVDGNGLDAPATWTFTTASAGLLSIWPPNTVPAVAASSDPGAVELGVKFRVDVAGLVHGIRFYKGPGNGGSHVGNLWRTDGTLLGTVTFAGESSSGWQQANFATPVPVSPGVTYVASYHAPQGHYAVDGGYFTEGVDSGVLHALASGVDGPNGLYAYGPGGYPASSYQAGNYWIDIVFEEDA